MTNKRLKTPLGRVRGLGAAKSGTQHFWLQRLTGVALVPLTVIFVVVTINARASSSVFAVMSRSRSRPAAWMTPCSAPCSATVSATAP